MTDFADRVWQGTTPLRAAIHALPFNTELAAGTLSRETFRFYIVQDALYLDQYARTLALAGARGPDGKILREFGHYAIEAIAVEQALHERYLTEFGVDPASLATAEPSPDCLGYTSFLLATAYHEPWEVLVSALLPCFWLYWDVGTSIARDAAADNPYRAWIDTYADEGFGEAVRGVIAATNQAADAAGKAVRDRMTTAFVRSCQYRVAVLGRSVSAALLAGFRALAASREANIAPGHCIPRRADESLIHVRRSQRSVRPRRRPGGEAARCSVSWRSAARRPAAAAHPR